MDFPELCNAAYCYQRDYKLIKQIWLEIRTVRKYASMSINNSI